MTSDDWDEVVQSLDQAFLSLAGVSGQGTAAALNARLADGKLYELRVLAWLLAQLIQSGYRARLVNGSVLLLRHRPGPVDASAPHIELRDAHGAFAGEIWCNVEFVGIGFEFARNDRYPASNPQPEEPDYHELDIAVTWRRAPDGHLPREIISIACECKDRRLEKSMLREMLGLRRELSYFHQPEFGWQFLLPNIAPIKTQNPPIRLFLCSSSTLPNNYKRIAQIHAIHVEHVPI